MSSASSININVQHYDDAEKGHADQHALASLPVSTLTLVKSEQQLSALTSSAPSTVTLVKHEAAAVVNSALPKEQPSPAPKIPAKPKQQASKWTLWTLWFNTYRYV